MAPSSGVQVPARVSILASGWCALPHSSAARPREEWTLSAHPERLAAAEIRDAARCVGESPPQVIRRAIAERIVRLEASGTEMNADRQVAVRRTASHAVVCLAPIICTECVERRLCVRGAEQQARALGETVSILDLVAWSCSTGTSTGTGWARKRMRSAR